MPGWSPHPLASTAPRDLPFVLRGGLASGTVSGCAQSRRAGQFFPSLQNNGHPGTAEKVWAVARRALGSQRRARPRGYRPSEGPALTHAEGNKELGSLGSSMSPPLLCLCHHLGPGVVWASSPTSDTRERGLTARLPFPRPGFPDAHLPNGLALSYVWVSMLGASGEGTLSSGAETGGGCQESVVGGVGWLSQGSAPIPALWGGNRGPVSQGHRSCPC